MSTPVTPASSTVAVAGSAPGTGTWRHPQFDEITRRQNASAFGEDQAKGLFSTGCLLFLTFAVTAFTPGWFANAAIFDVPFLSVRTLVWLARLILAINGTLTLVPLFRNRDEVVDIPLSASQRALLGLDPRVSTPGGSIVTPPRYARSATPRSAADRPLHQEASSPTYGSPFGSGGGNAFREPASSPFSPFTSPLLQRAVNGGRRRNSFSSGAAAQAQQSVSSASGWELYESLGKDSSSLAFDSSLMPGTPTPIGGGGKGPSVALTSRWKYERNRISSGHGSPGRVYG